MRSAKLAEAVEWDTAPPMSVLDLTLNHLMMRLGPGTFENVPLPLLPGLLWSGVVGPIKVPFMG